MRHHSVVRLGAGRAGPLAAALAVFWVLPVAATPPATSGVAGGAEGDAPVVEVVDVVDVVEVVEIGGGGVSPAEVRVPAGTEVGWWNRSGTPHTVTSEDGSFDSHPECRPPDPAQCLEPGEMVAVSFAGPGTYRFTSRAAAAGRQPRFTTVVVVDERLPTTATTVAAATPAGPAPADAHRSPAGSVTATSSTSPASTPTTTTPSTTEPSPSTTVATTPIDATTTTTVPCGPAPTSTSPVSAPGPGSDGRTTTTRSADQVAGDPPATRTAGTTSTTLGTDRAGSSTTTTVTADAGGTDGSTTPTTTTTTLPCQPGTTTPTVPPPPCPPPSPTTTTTSGATSTTENPGATTTTTSATAPTSTTTTSSPTAATTSTTAASNALGATGDGPAGATGSSSTAAPASTTTTATTVADPATVPRYGDAGCPVTTTTTTTTTTVPVAVPDGSTPVAGSTATTGPAAAPPGGAASGSSGTGPGLDGHGTPSAAFPAELRARSDAVERSGPSSTAVLVEAVARLEAAGVDRERAVRQVFGAFPVGGLARWGHDWLYPRFGPGWRLHQGTDVFAEHGTPVRAPVDGAVSTGNGGLGGLWVKVTQPDGTYWYLAHLSAVAPGISPGAAVSVGDVLGFVGNSGNAAGTPPHAHIEVHPFGGPAVDPKPILDALLAQAEAALSDAPSSEEAGGGGGEPAGDTTPGTIVATASPRTPLPGWSPVPAAGDPVGPWVVGGPYPWLQAAWVRPPVPDALRPDTASPDDPVVVAAGMAALGAVLGLNRPRLRTRPARPAPPPIARGERRVSGPPTKPAGR